ncbi:hypothetical protein [Aulosira sp. FACHB-615]|uniref:hypothetical protein n=1 Tax=Aulosira sp. FACHB-615 TaxID=2692777 RepID=UPI001687B95C|nr:hypothetical protein [Aulosira sp. FACHB-615]MBD2489034.1 hypothetical protein [Aulosira sp. FACHB-615]
MYKDRIILELDNRHSQTQAFIKAGASGLYRALLKKNYRVPKSYIQWQELAALITLISPEFNNTRFDLAQRFTSHRHALWLVQDAPIYCLDENLLELFTQTDIGDENAIFNDLVAHLPIHSLMLLLPDGGVRSPDGGYVDYLNIHASNIHHPEWSTGEKYGLKVPHLKHEHDVNVHYCCVDTQGTVWFSGWGINGGKLEQRDGDLGSSRSNELDKAFLRELRDLVMQSLMFLSFERTEIEAVSYRETVGSGFVSSKEPKEKCLYPRWLRLQESSKSRISKGGTHSSPSPHWRRGHWRRSAVGEGRTERKWNWIQPTLVGS